MLQIRIAEELDVIATVEGTFHIVGAAVNLNQRLPMAIRLGIRNALTFAVDKEMVGKLRLLTFHQSFDGGKAGATVVQLTRPLKKAGVQ